MASMDETLNAIILPARLHIANAKRSSTVPACGRKSQSDIGRYHAAFAAPPGRLNSADGRTKSCRISENRRLRLWGADCHSFSSAAVRSRLRLPRMPTRHWQRIFLFGLFSGVRCQTHRRVQELAPFIGSGALE